MIKSLQTYINESFIDFDTALADVPENMKDVAKLKILVKKWDKFGEEDDYEEGKDPYDRLIKNLEYTVKPKKFDELQSERRHSYSDDYNQKVKNRTKYCDKIFAAFYADYKKEKERGWGDPQVLTMVLVGIAYWIINYAGFNDKEIDKYLGKLCAKYQKVFGINPESATQITQMYDKKKVTIQDAINLENKTKASVQEIKNDFKNHKYTIFAGSHDSAAEIYMVDNNDYETLDEAYEKTVAKETSGSPVYGYDLDKKLRSIVNDGKVNALFLCSGYYCIGQNQDNTIPTFGYYDEDILGKEIYKYSTYDKKYYYSGKIPTEKKTWLSGQGQSYTWHDSLWTVWKKD